MSCQRLVILIAGPVVITAVSWWLAMPQSFSDIAAAGQRAQQATRPAPPIPDPPATSSLRSACLQTAAALKPRLTRHGQVIVRVPYVIAGDVDQDELDSRYRQIIQPIAGALRQEYFDREPTRPITIVMLSDGHSYRRMARTLDGYDTTHYRGHYAPAQRRIVLDYSSGIGALAHELTHALAAQDFPAIPEWLDEGLASLHEQSEFSSGEERLLGLHNWRLAVLLSALRDDRLPPLEATLRRESFRGAAEGLNYAHVRYLCLYLQRRGLLSDFYRRFRDNPVGGDSDGIATLCEITGTANCTDLDRAFRAWLQRITEKR